MSGVALAATLRRSADFLAASYEWPGVVGTLRDVADAIEALRPSSEAVNRVVEAADEWCKRWGNDPTCPCPDCDIVRALTAAVRALREDET